MTGYSQILDQAAGELAGTMPLPVDVRCVCENLGLKVVRTDLSIPRAQALLIDSPKGAIIYLPSKDRPIEGLTPFERFLVAHEIGHFVLLRACNAGPRGEGAYWKLERLCDDFASKLLLPDTIVTRWTAVHGRPGFDRLGRTWELAYKAAIPWETVALRLAKLVSDSAFFTLRIEEKGPPELRGKVSFSSLRNRLGLGKVLKADHRLGLTTGASIESSSAKLLGAILLRQLRIRDSIEAATARAVASVKIQLAVRLFSQQALFDDE